MTWKAILDICEQLNLKRMMVASRFFVQFTFGSSPEKIRLSGLVAMSRIHTGGQVLHMIRRHLKKTKDSNGPEKHQLHPVQKTLSNIALVIFSFIDLPAIKLYCHQTLDVVDISSCGRFEFAQEQIDVIF